MEIIPDRRSVYTATQVCAVIFILDNNPDATISKVILCVSGRFSQRYFSSVKLIGVIFKKFDFI